LYYTLADGDQNAIGALKRVDVFEFFTRLKVWSDNAEARLAKHKAALSGL
jgi:hypothetical protein